jgi:hypothetical protein
MLSVNGNPRANNIGQFQRVTEVHLEVAAAR